MTAPPSLQSLRTLKIGTDLRFQRTMTSSVTTAWGVRWDEDMIARDVMQNFFDANRSQLAQVEIQVQGADVSISAPAAFDLIRLFYLGSEKGKDDVGEYGEGFKAAVMCLMRDHRVEPIVLSQDQVVYLRIADEPVAGTQLRPILYDFYSSAPPIRGSRFLLRRCSPKLRESLSMGLDHFLHPANSLLGPKLWQSHDGCFAAYRSNGSDGHVFYRNLRRGQIPGIPIILVIDKEYAAIEKKIGHDRDRNAFGETLMQDFYKTFARYGAHYAAAQEPILLEARESWVRGHPLISALASAARWAWASEASQSVFADKHFARSSSHLPAQQLRIEQVERQWHQAGRVPLPQYFASFGVITALQHLTDLDSKALNEAKRRHSHAPSRAEMDCIDLLNELTTQFAPDLMAAIGEDDLRYCVADTEIVLGELKKNRSYRSYDVFLAAAFFEADFPEALSIFLHEHAHVFGHDGSRGFTDALTDLLGVVVRCRNDLDSYEARWDRARRGVVKERRDAKVIAEDTVDKWLTRGTEAELRTLLGRVPRQLLRHLIERRE